MFLLGFLLSKGVRYARFAIFISWRRSGVSCVSDKVAFCGGGSVLGEDAEKSTYSTGGSWNGCGFRWLPLDADCFAESWPSQANVVEERGSPPVGTPKTELALVPWIECS